jgi:hypothetical protein
MEVDVEGQMMWCRELAQRACDMIATIRAGGTISAADRLGRTNGLRFAYGRARELGFEKELDIFMLAHGVHIRMILDR